VCDAYLAYLEKLPENLGFAIVSTTDEVRTQLVALAQQGERITQALVRRLETQGGTEEEAVLPEIAQAIEEQIEQDNEQQAVALAIRHLELVSQLLSTFQTHEETVQIVEELSEYLRRERERHATTNEAWTTGSESDARSTVSGD
jgi:vacuolar-type H+-ATPase catalytic subunit A/Vma1